MIVHEKLQQSIDILQETDIDLWLTLVRETAQMSDPSLPFIAGTNIVWPSCFIISSCGCKIAIVGTGDANNIRRLDAYDEIISYDQSIQPPLISVLDRFNPKRIGLNYSEDNNTADGLTYGLYLTLRRLLKDTPYPERFVSAEPAVMRIRGRKSQSEVTLIEKAIHNTLVLFQEFSEQVSTGWTEKDVHRFLKRRMTEMKVEPAWDREYCPSVNAGLDSLRGHTPPGEVVIKPGHILRLDFGIKQNDYCSDLQRIWYFLKPNESAPPEDVLVGFETVQKTIMEASKMIRPGVRAYEIDALGREIIQEAGYPEFMHALGHQVGRNAHDGGTVIAPRWEKYGRRPYDTLEADQMYTLELGVQTSAGYAAQEEVVLVTGAGCRFLSEPQKEIYLITLSR